MKTVNATSETRAEIAEAAILKMNMALKSLHLYPPDHVISVETVGVFLNKLQDYFEKFGRLNIGVEKDAVTVEGEVVGPESKIIANLALLLFRLKLALVSIGPKVDEPQLASLLTVLCMDPEESAEAGGAVELLWEKQTSDITISQATAKRIYEADPADSDREKAPDLAFLHLLLFKDTERSNAERRLLKRELFDSSDHLAAFLLHICGGGSDKEKAAVITEGALRRFNSLARYDTLDDRNYMFRAIAESLLALDDGLQAEAAASLLMTNSAALALARRNIFEQLSLDEMAEIFTKALELTSVAHDRVVDAVGNLSIDNNGAERLAPRLAKMLPLEPSAKARLSEMEAVDLSVQAADAWQQNPEEPRRLADLVASTPSTAIAAIRNEVDTISENQIKSAAVGVLAELAAAETETQRFAIFIKGLRVAFVDAFDGSAFADATAILSILVMELRTRYRDGDKMVVIKNVIGEAGRRERLAILLDRIEKDMGVTFEDGERYLLLLGSPGVASLLDILATESSPGRRRLLCRLLVSCGRQNLASVGSKILDHRWYLVRNVAAILGQVGSDASIRYLERAVSHEDSRVRLETVRALSGLGPKSLDALKLLASDSERNIQLEAIAAIGNGGGAQAVPFLSEIAARRDLLNRNLDSRVAAVEALGSAQDRSALPILEKLSRTGPLPPSNRIGTAARAAIERLKDPNE